MTAPSPGSRLSSTSKKGNIASLVRELAASAVSGSKLRRPDAAKPHVLRADGTQNTKPSGFVGRRPASGCIFPEAARLPSAYNLQASRHRKAVSAGEPLPDGTKYTRDHNYSLFTIHYSLKSHGSGCQLSIKYRAPRDWCRPATN